MVSSTSGPKSLPKPNNGGIIERHFLPSLQQNGVFPYLVAGEGYMPFATVPAALSCSAPSSAVAHVVHCIAAGSRRMLGLRGP